MGCSALRRMRITAEYRDASLRDLGSLAIDVDPDTNRYAWTDTLSLAERFGLTMYDATYLELAFRLKLPLASLDQQLRAAAAALRLTVLG